MKQIAVTGPAGFIGKNLMLFIKGATVHRAVGIDRSTDLTKFFAANEIDVIVHLAGVNRSSDLDAFSDNASYLREVLIAAESCNQHPCVIYASSTQAVQDNLYGSSKRAAEEILREYSNQGGRGIVLRLPNIFGKFSRPNYNSVVATFCTQLVQGTPLTIHDPASPLSLYYIDDLCTLIIKLIDDLPADATFKVVEIDDVYETTVGEVAETLRAIDKDFRFLSVSRCASSLADRLRSTLASYFPANYTIPLTIHEDVRGQFFEVMRSDIGQFSVLTSKPGVVRGLHYHHSKFESFLVLQGIAEFITWTPDGTPMSELITAEERRAIMTQPGLVHAIKNVGEDELIVWVWANENFDPAMPDTYAVGVVQG
jgi:UDP-2-acetamido-2,6-beta-L-arabino-hexul-4-ose reductase